MWKRQTADYSSTESQTGGGQNTDMVDDVVAEILRNALGLEEGFALHDATRLQEIPNLDSLGQVRLVIEIERIVGDQLSMEEIIGIESVGQIRDLLVAKGKLRVEG